LETFGDSARRPTPSTGNRDHVMPPENRNFAMNFSMVLQSEMGAKAFNGVDASSQLANCINTEMSSRNSLHAKDGSGGLRR